MALQQEPTFSLVFSALGVHLRAIITLTVYAYDEYS